MLLPLSGRVRGDRQRAARAIELAPAGGTRWLFLDTRGDARRRGGRGRCRRRARARSAILGPVGEREAIAAARAAALRGVPIALLAPADGADPERRRVPRSSRRPADEGRAVAQLAAEDSFPTVGVFAPRDDIGREAAEAFVAEATAARPRRSPRRAPTIRPAAISSPTSRTFLDLVPARNPRLAEHLARHGKKGWATFSPDVPFSLLYIPDRYDRAAIVAAFLPYYNVELRTTEFPDPRSLARKHGGHMPQVVQLVGGAGWHHPSLPVRGGAAVQGALIVDVVRRRARRRRSPRSSPPAFQQRTRRAPSTAAAAGLRRRALIVAARAPGAPPAPRDPRAALRARARPRQARRRRVRPGRDGRPTASSSARRASSRSRATS